MSAVAVGLAALTFAVAALTARGVPAAEVSLHDGGVWVTNTSLNHFGRFNRPIEQLDAVLSPGSTSQARFDVLQEEQTVFLVDFDGGLLRAVNPAQIELDAEGPALPSDPDVALGGGVVALLEKRTGRLWTRPADQVVGLKIDEEEPTAVVGGTAAVAVGRDGTVHAVSSDDDRLMSIRRDGTRDTRKLPIDVTEATVTAVGDAPVVLSGQRVVLPGDDVVTVGPGARLQQAGPDASDVLVATDKELLRIDLSGDGLDRLSNGGSGGAASPVRLGDCVHAAWVGSYERHCDGAAPQAAPLTDLGSDPRLVFRVNRDAIVLNDVASGAIFLFERGGENLGKWEQLIEQAEPSKDPEEQQARPRDERENTPPKAEDDAFGARPGTPSVLHVLDNDSDPDRDVLVVSEFTAVRPAGAGRLAIVHSGQALQFLPSPGTREGTVSFKYTIDDGRGGKDSAAVTVAVRAGGNTLPHEAQPAPVIEVEQGGSASHNVLRGWRDKDGDPLLLVAATTAAPDKAHFTPAGELTFVAAPNSAPGTKTVTYEISDGHEPSRATGKLTVKVLGRDVNGAPRAEDDIVSSVEGQAVTIRPLDNDRDPNTTVPGGAQRLRLSWVSQAPVGSSAAPDYVANTISFTAAKAGSYRLDYRITDGRTEVGAKIRIDVRAASSAHGPVAVADQLGVRGTAAGTVDVLANDVDLDGDVLVVQSVQVPENAGLTVSVIEHRWLRVAASRSQVGSDRSSVQYVVSDGDRSDTGVLTVTRLPGDGANQPPIAVPDVGVVRAGDVVAVDVLTNDSDPDGSSLSLEAVVSTGQHRDNWMTSGRQVRFRAPAELVTTATATATYTVRDDRGASAVGEISITVFSAEAPNQVPQPPPIDARAFAGAGVRVQIPLTGVDPEGDSVLLLGPASAPKLGRIVKQGLDFLDYEAYPGVAGTDVFTYRVMDAFGGRGTGTVRIGVIPFPARNSAPVAVDDVLTVAPGVAVRVPVLANDSDIDGDPLRLEPLQSLNPQLPPGVSIVADRVLLTAAANDGEQVTVRYGVSDGRGARATASVTLLARDGANLPPVARDDIADPPVGGATHVEVDVLANDDDLDGTREELELSALGGGEVTADGRLRIPLAEAARQIAYQIADRHGATATAFVRVPGSGDRPPRLREDLPDLVVPHGGELTVDIAELTMDPEGRPVRLTATTAISASPPTGLSLVPGGSTQTSFKVLAAAGYSGHAGVIFEVTDGANVVSLSLPLTVAPGPDEAPTFACPPAEPTAGAPAVVVDLMRCVRGAGDAFTFDDLSAAPPGLTAELNGARLVISAAPDAQVGERGELTLTVIDERGGSTQGRIGLVVRPSGLAVAVTDTLEGVHADAPVRLDVTANDENPFPATPLKVVGIERVAGDAVTMTVDADRRHVVMTPTKVGRATFAYRVQDATGKPDREVTGQVVVNVIDHPAVPGAPVIREEGNRFVVLAWGEPEDGGAPIDHYLVTGSHGFSQTCELIVCRLENLTNGRPYTFTVKAHNSVGYSDPSPGSAEAHPDAKPGRPSPPTTRFGDQSMTVTWQRPSGNGGSAIRLYRVEISPPAGGRTRQETSGTSLVWNGLTNGVAYTFRVQAVNANQESDWSGYSAPDIPARQPDTPAAPTANGVADGIGEQIRVDWAAPGNNGASISRYHLTVIRSGTVERTVDVPGDTTTATVDVDNGVTYTFRLSATNKAGTSPQSPASAGTVAHGKPFPVTSHSYSDNSGGTGYDRRVAYTLNAPDDNGMAIVRYEFDVDGNGSADRSGTGTSGFVTGLSNGTTYRIRVRACNDTCGNWSSAGNSVRPYGPVPTPNAGAAKQGATQVRLSWSSGGSNGRDIARIETSINGGGWENRGTAAGSVVVGNGYDQTHSIRVRAFDSAGQVSAIASASATTDSPPPPTPPTVTVYRGTSAVGRPNCTHSSCAYVAARLDNFPANRTFTCSVTHSGGGSGTGTLDSFNISTNGSGSGSGQGLGYFGYPNGQVTVTCNGVSGTKNPWYP